MVEECDRYAWSSYHANANGQKDLMITPHPVYLHLGKNKSQRLEAYRALFKGQLNNSLISEIQQTTQTGTLLGSDKFKREVEELLRVKVGYATRGRPAKVK